MRASVATRPTSSGSASTRTTPGDVTLDVQPAAPRAACEVGRVAGPEVGAGAREELGLGALRHDATVADDDDVVGDHLDLVEEVGREEHGRSPVRVAPEQVAHPPDAGGVEAVGRLVEDEDPGVSQQGVRDAEPLTHPEGVVADPAPGLRRGQADQLQHLVDPAAREPHHLLAQAQDLPTRTPGVLRRGVEEHADLQPRVGQVGEAATGHVRIATGRWGEPGDDPQGGGLPGPVGAEEAGDAAGRGGEADVVDGGEAAVGLGDVLNGDHRGSSWWWCG